MKLRLKNIGILRDAVIEIAGITLVSGENNTGKSTFGKALFAVFGVLHAFPERACMMRQHAALKAWNWDVGAEFRISIKKPELQGLRP